MKPIANLRKSQVQSPLFIVALFCPLTQEMRFQQGKNAVSLHWQMLGWIVRTKREAGVPECGMLIDCKTVCTCFWLVLSKTPLDCDQVRASCK